ncbi:unnamed protein product [Closterium sp. NIES-53]
MVSQQPRVPPQQPCALPLQPARRPCSPARRPCCPARRPCSPTRRPCGPLAAPCGPRAAPATLCAASATPCAAPAALCAAPCGKRPLAAPCSLHAAPCSPLSAPCGPLAAPCDPLAAPCSLRTALWQPGRHPFAALPCLRAALLVARHPALPTMASLRVLTFDHEGRPIQFDTWLDDLLLYLLSESRHSVLLFDHMSGASLAPPATADSATRSQWLTFDAAARLAIRNHLLLAECPHFGQHKTAKALQGPLESTDLTVDLLEQHLLAAETSVVAVGATRGTPRMPFFEGCSPSPIAPSYASAAAVDILGAEDVGAASASGKRPSSKGKGGRVVEVAVGVVVGAAVEVVEVVEVVATIGLVAGVGVLVAAVVAAVGVAVVAAVGVVAVEVELFRGEVLVVASGSSSSSVGARPLRPSSFVSGFLSVGHLGVVLAARMSFARVTVLVRHAGSLTLGTTASPAKMTLGEQSLVTRPAEGDCYLRVPPDPGIEAAALGASESALPGTAPAEALHTFTLDSGASRCFFCDSTTLTPLSAHVTVRLADPSGGPVLAHSSSVFPLPLPSRMVTTTTPGSQRESICTCTRTGRHLATFNHWPGSSLYTPATEPPQVAASARVYASRPVAPLCLCHLLSHQSLLWHHRLGHPSLPRLHGMHSCLLVFGLPRSLPLLPPSPAPPCLPCVEGRQRAAPHSSSFPPTTAPLQTLHMDVWGLAHVSGQGHERYFLLVVDDYTHYTTVFPLRSKGEVPDLLIPWICAVHLQLREQFGQDLPILHLHSDRGGEFSSDLLRDFCRGEVILQSFTLPASPQQNGIAENRIGLAMEVALSVAVDSGAARGPASGGAKPAGADLGGAEFEGAGSGGAELGGAEPGGAEPEGAEPRGVESGGAEPRAARVVAPRTRLWSGDAGAGDSATGGTRAGGAGATTLGGAGVPAGAGGPGAAGGAGPGGARTRGTRAAGAGGAAGAGAGDTGAGGARAGGTGASAAGGTGAVGPGGARTGGTGAAGADGAAGIGAGGTGAGAAGGTGAAGASGAAGVGAGDTGAGGAGPGVTGAVGAGSGDTGQPRPYFVPLLQHVLEHRELASHPASPVCTGRRVPRPRPPPVPGTHAMALRPSSVPLHVPLPPPLESSLPDILDPESDHARAAVPTISRLLASVVSDPSFESTAASALVSELVDFAATCRLDYATALVTESEFASPPSIEGECALGTDVLEDKQEDFECLAAAAAMDAEMASWKSTGTYVDAVLPSRTNIVDGMWIFRGVDYFQTFSPTPKMTTLRMLLHVAKQRDYELHSPDFSTAFLQGSLHEEIWLRRPPGFTRSFRAGTQWSLRRQVYGLRQAHRKWHNTALGFTPSTADPSLFLRTDTSLPPFYVLVYVDDLVFATADTEALTLVKSELHKRHTCTDLGELRSYLGLQITRDRARRTITLTQSHKVHQVLQRFGFQFSSPKPTPMSTSHSL